MTAILSDPDRTPEARAVLVSQQLQFMWDGLALLGGITNTDLQRLFVPAETAVRADSDDQGIQQEDRKPDETGYYREPHEEVTKI